MAIADKIVFEVIQPKNYTATLNNFVGQYSGAAPSHSDSDSQYVAKTGSDTNDGTSSNPVLTLTQAAANCQSSGLQKIVIADSGAYINESVNLGSGITHVIASSGVNPSVKSLGNSVSSVYFEDLSTISRRLFSEYNDVFYAACSSGTIDRIYTTPDGETWTEKFDNDGDNFTSVGSVSGSNITGIYFGNDNGKIIKFTDPDTSATVYNEAGEKINGICEYNGYVFAVSSGTTQKLLRSADGSTFSEAFSGWSSEVDGQEIKAVIEYNEELVVAFSQGILSSTTGTAFTTEKIFDIGGFEISKMAVYEDFLYIVTGIGGLYRSQDLQTWYKVASNNITDIIVNNNLYYVSSDADLYRSENGVDFSLIYALTSANGAGVFQGMSYFDDTRFNSCLFKTQSEVIFQGITFETNNIDYAVYSSGQNCKSFYNTFTGFYNSVIQESEVLQFNNCIIYDCTSGIIASSGIISSGCLFYNIEKTAIDFSGDYFDIDHNTIYNSNKGIHITSSELDFSSVKNSIFYYCHEYGVYSDISLTLVNCLYSKAELNNYVICNGCIEADPLFTSTLEGAENFRLKTLETGFQVLQSPAKAVGTDAKDLGCYDVTYSESDRATLEFEINATPESFNFSDNRTEFQSSQAISGTPIITFPEDRRSFSLSWGQENYISNTDLFSFWRLFRTHAALYYKPAKLTGYTDSSGTNISGSGVISDYPEAQLVLDIQDNDYAVYYLKDVSQSWDVGKWKGWTVISSGQPYKILYNTSDTLIIDSDTALSSGVYAIDRIKCRIDGQSLSQAQRIYDGFKYSQIINSISISFTEADI